jgi:glycosyltransferase involved in cell wall biosynthesis
MELEKLRAWRTSAPHFYRRQMKTMGQLRYGWDHPKQVSFVFGCQRSGTKMLMRVLDESPATRIFHENHASAFHDFQLRSDRVLRALVRLSPAPCQVFKPICDSHRADALLAAFPAARAVWLYRHPDDVATSSVQKWGAHQRDVVDAVAAGDLARWGWRTDRVPAPVVEAIRAVHRPDLGAEEGAMLFWYLRNAFFFALGLHADRRVRLVRYEDLAQRPQETFPSVFAHLGAPFSAHTFAQVHAHSVRKKDRPRASDAIRALCAGLLARLDAAVPVPVPAVTPSVLVVVDRLTTGGAERYAVTLSNWLAERGGVVSLVAAPGELRSELLPSVSYVPVERTGDTRTDVRRGIARVRALVRERPPAAIVTNSVVTTWVARVARGRRRIPIVAVAHGWPAGRYRFVARLLRGADRVVAVSAEVRGKLVAGGLDPARCEVVFNGVECDRHGPRTGEARATARSAMGAGPDDVLVVSVGRLSAQKAHQHLVDVAARLRRAHPRLRYAVVGGGERAEELEALVEEAGVGDIVRLLGLRADVPDLLGAADVYLTCSEWEGMPLATIEAMASALPTVSTRTEGAAQLLTPACGVIVPTGDVVAMADAVVRLAGDAPLRARMGEAARRRAFTAFGHDRMAGELMDIVNRLVAQ